MAKYKYSVEVPIEFDVVIDCDDTDESEIIELVADAARSDDFLKENGLWYLTPYIDRDKIEVWGGPNNRIEDDEDVSADIILTR